MNKITVKFLAAAAASVLVSGATKAAVITNTYTVVGSNFLSTAPSPYASITESFTVTFDTTASAVSQVTGISLNPASTIIPTSTLAFTHLYFPGLTDSLIIGGTAATVGVPDRNSTDFAVIIQNASSSANFSITSISYSLGTGTLFAATRVQKGSPPAPVPEPASLAVLATFGATFAFLRRRRPGRKSITT